VLAAFTALTALFFWKVLPHLSVALLQNLTMLASFPLAATGAFYLCRYLGGGTIGSAAGGFIFAFKPWHVAQAMHHAHVAGIEFLPFFANVRTPARAIVFVYLFLGIGAAMAIATVLKRKPTLLTGAALACVLALMLGDFFPRICNPPRWSATQIRPCWPQTGTRISACWTCLSGIASRISTWRNRPVMDGPLAKASLPGNWRPRLPTI